MPITRAKANRLLNQSEMGLYDDSRANGLRDLDARALASRVKRARTARDRTRTLVQKQKLASRARTGSKRGASGADNQRSKDKAELMADILKRFEQQLKAVERADRDAARAAATSSKGKASKGQRTRAAASKAKGSRTAAVGAPANATREKRSTATGTSNKTASKRAASKKTATKKTASNTPAATKASAGRSAKKAAAKPASAMPPATRASGKSAAPPKASRSTATSSTTARAADARSTGAARKTTRKRRITPEQALEQTRALLEAKHTHDAEPRPWQDLPSGPAATGEPGFQSDAAARRAARLHAAEARIPAIQGSVSTRDRINQGKRDHRGGSD